MPRGATRHGPRLDQPRRLGGHGAPEAEGHDVDLRPPALEGDLDADLSGRADPRRRAAAPTRLDPDSPHPGPRRRPETDPRGRARASLPASRRPRPGLPRPPRRPPDRDVPAPLPP